MTAIQKKIKKLPHGSTLDVLTLSVDRERWVRIIPLLNPPLVDEGTYGTGFLKYMGKYSKNRKVFAGGNENIKNKNLDIVFTIKFFGNEGLEAYDHLRSSYFNRENPKGIGVKTSSLETFYLFPAPKNVKTLSKFRTACEKTKPLQKHSSLKVEYHNNTLVVGGPKSSNSLSIIPNIGKGGSLKTLAIRLKGKNTLNNLNRKFVENPVATGKALLGSLKLGHLACITMTNFMKKIRQQILNDFNVGMVLPKKAKKKDATSGGTTLTKSGISITRSLNGVLKKLMNPSTFYESESIFLQWLNALKEDSIVFEGKQYFLQKILQTLKQSPGTVSPTLFPPSSPKGEKNLKKRGINSKEFIPRFFPYTE